MSIPVDIILNTSTLCNLELERQAIQSGIDRGEHLVVFGRRNTGKTSLVVGVCVPQFLKERKHAIAVVVDFLGVTTMEDLEQRLKRAIEKALSKSFPNQESIKSILALVKGLRPQISFDALSGNLDLALDIKPSARKSSLEQLIDEINALADKFPVLLVFDEFQDLAFVKPAIALIRGQLQRLKANTPVIILGSKKHLLSKIFAVHRAPLAGWGRDVQIPEVKSNEYREAYYKHVQVYFKECGLKIEPSIFNDLVDYVQGIPESINIVCNYLMRNSVKFIDKEIVRAALSGVVEERRSRFEEMLARLRTNERIILAEIARLQPVKQIKSKDFLSAVKNVAPTSVLHAVRKLEDLAEIYQTEEGYVIAEPLLGFYLQNFR